MLNKPEATAAKKDAADKKDVVVVKKYANRRLYNTETSTYVTLEDLATMVRSNRDFVVYDAKTGDELTHSVLTQIIVEQEGRQGGQTLLPVPFLRQLIRFYDDSIARMVPSYLQMSVDTLVKEQERYRAQFAKSLGPAAFGSAAFEAYQEQARKNLAMFEQAMILWSPFRAVMPAKDEAGPAMSPAGEGETKVERTELDEMKQQLADMQARIEKLSQDRTG